MGLGAQEIVALLLVTAVIGLATYRRWRRGRTGRGGCAGCDESVEQKESPIHFYRRRD